MISKICDFYGGLQHARFERTKSEGSSLVLLILCFYFKILMIHESKGRF